MPYIESFAYLLLYRIAAKSSLDTGVLDSKNTNSSTLGPSLRIVLAKPPYGVGASY
jgi:hypothetical protein